ncbi:MAG: hypothetical protein JOZ39_05660 [Chloroflexi bacterium]|nr:hypothetical protein [Chloroflexota bacterium]
MEAELAAELDQVIQRLKDQHENGVPIEFRLLAETTIEPALNEIAERIRANGYECTVEADTAAGAEAGQSVCLVLDRRYTAGSHPLCFRLIPGESLVRMEKPAVGDAVTTDHVPFGQLTRDSVQRVAIDFLEHVV